MADVTKADVTRTQKDAAYVVVGLGVLGFQRSQVRRRELQEQFAKLATDFEQRLQPVVDEIEGRLDEFETRLPEQARDFVHQARTLAKDAQQQIRNTYAAA